MQECSHAFAMKSQIWLLDPRPNLPAIVKAVHDGFELSEASRTPVMLELRVRSCHVHGSFVKKPNLRPPYTLREALELISCRCLVKGYSDTHARGSSKFDRLLRAVALLKGRPDAAVDLAALRAAALADSQGQ